MADTFMKISCVENIEADEAITIGSQNPDSAISGLRVCTPPSPCAAEISFE
jgi:hypothetical protein